MREFIVGLHLGMSMVRAVCGVPACPQRVCGEQSVDSETLPYRRIRWGIVFRAVSKLSYLTFSWQQRRVAVPKRHWL